MSVWLARQCGARARGWRAHVYLARARCSARTSVWSARARGILNGRIRININIRNNRII